ncbi:type I restriction endonuclease subunit S [Pseudoglutamicibacter albus]|uniref:type I restriction endonuclease subunit S n=1 Tax=Pseudoglutamicibacter albus TaxID=98671 RepID=UPI0012EC8557|nr:type I restriction endonuclease subunit S [Pseudoglutamicibacter albus]
MRYSDLFEDRVERAKQQHHYKVVEAGDIVLNKMSAATGAVGLAREKGLVSPDYATFKVADTADEVYVAYLLQNGRFLDEVSTILRGIGVGEVNNARTPRVSVAEYLRINAYLPPLETQRAIADYLDRETDEIDAMSADLDEMEALLKERRSTVIRRHLQLGDGKRVPIIAMAQVLLGKMIQPSQKNSAEMMAPYLRAAHVPAAGTLDLTVDTKEMWFSEAELTRLTLRSGDVVIVEGGAGYGRAAFIPSNLDGWGFQNSIIRVRAREGIANGKYIAYALQQAQVEGEIELCVSTATLPHFTAEKVERFRLPLPPLNLQCRVVAEIDRETAEIDAMLADIAELRGLLAERRAAVIAAAVTGQLDIPGIREATHV